MSFKKQSDDSNGIWVQDLEWRKDDRQYGTYVQYVQYEATLPLLTKKLEKFLTKMKQICTYEVKLKCKVWLGGHYGKLQNNDHQIMYNGNFWTLGPPSVPSETKNPQIEMKSLSELSRDMQVYNQNDYVRLDWLKPSKKGMLTDSKLKK